MSKRVCGLEPPSPGHLGSVPLWGGPFERAEARIWRWHRRCLFEERRTQEHGATGEPPPEKRCRYSALFLWPVLNKDKQSRAALLCSDGEGCAEDQRPALTCVVKARHTPHAACILQTRCEPLGAVELHSSFDAAAGSEGLAPASEPQRCNYEGDRCKPLQPRTFLRVQQRACYFLRQEHTNLNQKHRQASVFRLGTAACEAQVIC